jgi:hypothetical protein
MHATGLHAVTGYSAEKQPLPGSAALVIAARQAT